MAELLLGLEQVAEMPGVLSLRASTAELFEAERCGCWSNQLPVLAFIISSSSGEKRQMVAERRMPPASTAFAMNMLTSYTSMGRRARPAAAVRISPTRSSAFRSGRWPGALPPEVLSSAPRGRIAE